MKISEYIGNKISEVKVSLNDISSITGVAIDKIMALIAGDTSVTLEEINRVLHFLQGELSVTNTTAVWMDDTTSELGVQETLFQLFNFEQGRRLLVQDLAPNTLEFLLQYIDSPENKDIKGALLKAIEYYESRITVLEIMIHEHSDDFWSINISYFNHEVNFRENLVIPYPRRQNPASLPETVRRIRYEEFIRNRKIADQLETLDNMQWSLDQTDRLVVNTELDILLLDQMDLEIMDEASKTLIKSLRAKLEASR